MHVADDFLEGRCANRVACAAQTGAHSKHNQTHANARIHTAGGQSQMHAYAVHVQAHTGRDDHGCKYVIKHVIR